MSAAETIRELAIPVVMISANGLICLALYNRLAAITSRLRVFYRERFDLDLRLVAELESGEERSAHEPILRQRLLALDQQCESALRRAWHVRSALILLLVAVIGMLAITLMLGLLQVLPSLAPVALATFVCSVLLMIGGIALAIGELLLYLEPVKAEGLALRDRAAMAKTIPRRKRVRSKQLGRSEQRRTLHQDN